MLQKIAPTQIRYIKLGQGNEWAQASLQRGEIRFGYRIVPHSLCVRGAWDAVREILVKDGNPTGFIELEAGSKASFCGG